VFVSRSVVEGCAYSTESDGKEENRTKRKRGRGREEGDEIR